MASKRLPKSETEIEQESMIALLFDDTDESFTDKEKLFILSYVSDAKFNQTAAARAAGYNCNSDLGFRVQGSELMSKRKIKAKIDSILESLIAPKMKIIYELQRIADGSILDVMDDNNKLDLNAARERGTDFLISEITIEENVIETKTDSIDLPDLFDDDPRPAGKRPKPKAEQVIETNAIVRKTKFKIHSRLKALELVGNHFGLFSNNLKISNPDGTPIGSGNGQVMLLLPDNGRGDAPYLKPAAALDASKTKPARKASSAKLKTPQNASKSKAKSPKTIKITKTTKKIVEPARTKKSKLNK